MRTKKEIAQEIWEQSLREIVCAGTLGQAVTEIFRDFTEDSDTGTD